jgi:hypothetical protein
MFELPVAINLTLPVGLQEKGVAITGNIIAQINSKIPDELLIKSLGVFLILDGAVGMLTDITGARIHQVKRVIRILLGILLLGR